MACRTVQDRTVGHVLAVVDKDCPELYKEEKSKVRDLLQREDEGEDVVGHGLHPAVYRVECNRGVGSGHDPLVMRLVEGLVDERMMQTSVDEVDAEIRKEEEERELQIVVICVWLIGEFVIKFGVSAHIKEEERRCEDRNEGHCVDGLFDFHSDLVLEELGVLEGGLIEDEDVGERRDNKVNSCASDPGTS